MEFTTTGVIIYAAMAVPYALLLLRSGIIGRDARYRELATLTLGELSKAKKEAEDKQEVLGCQLMIAYNFSFLGVTIWNVTGLLTTNWPFHVAFVVIELVRIASQQALGSRDLTRSSYMIELGHAILIAIVIAYAAMTAMGW